MNNASAKNKPVIQPLMGLFLDRPAWQVDPRGFTDCNNVRVHLGKVTNAECGWTRQSYKYNGSVTMDANFHLSIGVDVRIIGTPKDIYNWNNGNPVFITPSYTTGTIDVSGVNVTGHGTLWTTQVNSAMVIRAAVQPGDQVYIGSNTQNSPTANWYTVDQVISPTQLTLTSAPPAVSGALYTIRQLAQGDDNKYKWAWEVFPKAGTPFFGDVFFCTNGIDQVVAWQPANTFAEWQTTIPFTCFYLRRFKNLMIYGGLTYNGELLPTAIANSDNGTPNIMNKGIAGQYIVSDNPYTINWLGILGNILMIYMGDISGGGSVVSGNFVGAPVNFVFNEIIKGRGPIGGRLVAEFPDRHQFLGSDGEYKYNGLYTQVMNTQVWRSVLLNYDSTRNERSFCYIDYAHGELIWALPLLTDAGFAVQTAYVEHYMEQAQSPLFKPITKRDFPFTTVGTYAAETYNLFSDLTSSWTAYAQRWPTLDTIQKEAYPPRYAGDINGYSNKLYVSNNQNGAAFLSFVQFPPRLTINERSRGLVKRIYPYLEADNTAVTVTLTMQDKVGGVNVITDVQTINQSSSTNRFTTHYRRGRLAAIKFSTFAPDVVWNLDGYDLDIAPGGVR